MQGIPCTVDSCDPENGVSNEPAAAGTSCADADICNGDEICDGAGVCAAGDPPIVPDDGDCVVYTCDPVEGAIGTPASEGSPCQPDACSTGECDASATCVLTGTLDVDDGDDCTIDRCDPETGPYHVECSPLDPNITTSMLASNAWLIDEGIQTGVEPDTIQLKSAALIRGRVTEPSGEPIPNVEISVVHHPEFGQTTTHADGTFDMLINGGASVQLSFDKAPEYIRSARHVGPGWNEATVVDDVVLLHRNAEVTEVTLDGTETEFQAAVGSQSVDTDGTRTGAVLFPPGVQAMMIDAAGNVEPLSSLDVRITEFTVGPAGEAAMPAALPTNTAYTYAFEIDADQAIAADAVEVAFSEPLPYYVNNFLNFPTGSPVPLGSYDRIRGVWVPHENGVIVEIVSNDGAQVALDVDGDGLADANLSAHGISPPELGQLADLCNEGVYAVGDSLWRVTLPHWSPYDANWPWHFPHDATEPTQSPSPDTPVEKMCTTEGSIIECQNQVLRETVPIAGTDLALNYTTRRAPGHTAPYVIETPLAKAGEQFSAALLGLKVSISVAGQNFEQIQLQFTDPPPSLFVWDGYDNRRRRVVGRQKATVRVSHRYRGHYAETTYFGAPSNGADLSGDYARGVLESSRTWVVPVGGPLQYADLGGWSISEHHHLSPLTHQLLLGDGTDGDARMQAPVIRNVAGMFGNSFVLGDGGDGRRAYVANPSAVTAGADGTVYIAAGYRIRRVTPNGTISTYAGSGASTISGDGGPATLAGLGTVYGMRMSGDGVLYLASTTTNNHFVRRIDPDGTIHRVAGIPNANAASGDDGPALQAGLGFVTDVELSSDGSIYVAAGNRVRLIDPGGTIRTVAGNGAAESAAPMIEDGMSALQAPLRPQALAMDPQGTLYILHQNGVSGGPGERIYALDGGRLRLIAGCPESPCPGGIGLPATKLRLKADPLNLAVDRAGKVFFVADADPNPSVVAYRIMTIDEEGNLQVPFHGDVNYGEGQLGVNHGFTPSELAFGPRGLLIAEAGNQDRVTEIIPAVPGYGLTETLVASESGTEAYVFDVSGRHLRTINAYTNATIRTFDYDLQGRLVAITDTRASVPRTTQIERDAEGNATAILAPFGQRTELSLNTDGFIDTIESPEAEQTSMTYTPDGLLLTFTDGRGGTSEMTYDEFGRLITSENAADDTQTLTRSGSRKNWSVERATPMGRTTSYEIGRTPEGAELLTNTFSDGTTTTQQRDANEVDTTTLPDGTIITQRAVSDPQWGANAPRVSTTTQLPSGLTKTTERQSTVDVSNNLNPLSLRHRWERTIVNGRTTETHFSKADLLFTTTTPAGRVSTRKIDSLGRTTEARTASFHPVKFFYDASGRLSQVQQGSRNTFYDFTASGPAAGYLDTITDPTSRLTTMTRDAVGRVTSETLEGVTTHFAWDENSNLTEVTPPSKPTHEMAYTPLNLMEVYDPPAISGITSPETFYEYNPDRDLERTTRPDGLSVDYTYDDAGRVETIIAPTGTITRSYFAPEDTALGQAPGKLSTLSGPYNTQLSYTYDGQLTTSETLTGDVAGTVEWTYNDDFVVTEQTVTAPGGLASTAFAYDADLLMTCASPTTCPSGADALTLTRSPTHGMVTQLSQGNVTETWSYSQYAELSSQASAYAGSPLLDITYGRDALGRITTKTEVRSGVTKVYAYAYDDQGRLETVTLDGVLIEEFSYDDNGNRLSGYKQGEGTTAGLYDDQDRLISYGDFSYTYTDNGELQTKLDTVTGEQWDYTYDVFGNLLSVSLPDGRFVEFVTDGRHRRVGKKVDGVMVRQWVFEDQLNPVAELDGSGELLWQYAYGAKGHSPDYVANAAGDVYRVISDQVGSPRLIVNVDDDTDVLFEAEYSAFGGRTVVAGDGTSLSLGFAGGELDGDSGLTRFGARDYDAEVGRWAAKDPLRFAATLRGLYGYADGDPINRIDPAGMEHQPGGPWHPPDGVSMGCKWTDSCSELSKKLDLLDRATDSHRQWDADRNTCRHEEEIADFYRARQKCVEIHQAKCANQPEWSPMEEVLPFVVPLIVVGCVLCPECCAVVIIPVVTAG